MTAILDFNVDKADGAAASNRQWIFPRCTVRFHGLPSNQPVDIELVLTSGAAGLYDYFPFLVEAKIDPGNVEVFEIDGPSRDFAVLFRCVHADKNGIATVGIRSELFGIPLRAGIGTDERPLVAELSFVAFHPCSELPAFRFSGPAVRSLSSRFDFKEDQDGPVFVIGAYRSGTSVLTWALGQHPNLLPLDETNWLRCTLLGAVAGYRQASAPQLNSPQLYDVSQEQYLRWIGKGLSEMHHSIGRDRAFRTFLQRTSDRADRFHRDYQIVRSRWNPKFRWVDGTPENTGIATVIAQTFPTSQFVAMVRNPRQVVASLMHFDRLGETSRTLDEAIDYWLRMTEIAMRTLEMLGPQRVLVVFFDDMIQKPSATLRRIFAFLGESNFDKSAATFSTRINSSSIEQNDLNRISGTRILAAEAVFRQLCAGTPASKIDWGPQTVGDLDELTNELTERVVAAVS